MAPLQPDEGSEDANVTRIRQRIIELSLNGEFQLVTEYLEHPEPDVRATALRVLDNEGKLEKGIVERSLSDSAFKVRNALAYLISRNRDIPAMKFLLDEDAEIVEIACWVSGSVETHQQRFSTFFKVLLNRIVILCAENQQLLLWELWEIGMPWGVFLKLSRILLLFDDARF